MRLFTTYSHTLYPARLRSLKDNATAENLKTKNGRHEKKYRTLQRMAGLTCARAITSTYLQGKGGQRKRRTGWRKKSKQKARALGSKAEESITSRAKPQPVAKTHQNALCTKYNLRVGNRHRAPPCGGDVKSGGELPRKSPQEKLDKKPRTKTNFPRRSKIQNRENRIEVLEGSGGLNVNWPRQRLEVHLLVCYLESRVRLTYPDQVEGTRNLEHLLSKSCSEPEIAEA